jgi:hypothetical protein
MSIYKHPFIVRDSKQNLYKFSMSEDNSLILEKLYEDVAKSKTILKKNISNFTVDIDDKDVIHIIYVDMSNKIKYSIYSSEFIDNFFLNFDDENNDHRFLFFKFILDKLYLFFITRTSNNTQCALKRCIIKNNDINVETLLMVNCSKYTCPYYIYSTPDSIYILYSKDHDEKYTLLAFDVLKNKWHEHSNIIALTNPSHMNFIVKNDTVLICYNSFQNKNIVLRLASISLKSTSSFFSNQVLLSNTNSFSPYPLILNIKNHTHILWEEDNKITYCNFIYDEIMIVKKQYIPLHKSEVHYANYRSNFRDTLNVNATIAYTVSGNSIYIITDLQKTFTHKTNEVNVVIPSEIHKEVSILEEVSTLEEVPSDIESTSLVPINVDFLEITPYLNDYIKELYSSTTNTNKLLSNYNEDNKKLTNEVNYLARLNSTYKSRVEDLKNRLIKYRNDSATILTNYKNVINVMERDKNNLINIIKEKDNEISSLQNIINSREK